MWWQLSVEDQSSGNVVTIIMTSHLCSLIPPGHSVSRTLSQNCWRHLRFITVFCTFISLYSLDGGKSQNSWRHVQFIPLFHSILNVFIQLYALLCGLETEECILFHFLYLMSFHIILWERFSKLERPSLWQQLNNKEWLWTTFASFLKKYILMWKISIFSK